MKTRFLTILMILLAGAGNLFSQIAINNDGALPNSSAILDIKSDTAGVLIPRMTAVQRDAINNPAQGLMVYVTGDNTFYYFDSSSWQAIGSGSSGSSYWNLNGTTVSADSLYSVAIGTKNTSGNFEVSTDVGSGTYTADLCTGGVVSAQEHGGSYIPDHLFDNDNISIWRNDNTLPVWIQYDFGAGNEKKIQEYRLLWQGANFDFTPYSWDFLASNDGTAWTTLDSQTGQSEWTSGEWKEFVFPNQQTYRYYRLQISDNNGLGNTGVYLNEMEMMEEVYAQYPAFFVSSDKVGIGTQSPTANLQVDGSFKYVDGNEGNGKILSSDADGNAIWSDATNLGLTDADFFAEGTTLPPSGINDDIYTMGNVAIGKNLANYPVDIQSDSATRGVSVYLNDNSGSGSHFGSYNELLGSGGGTQIGVYDSIYNTGNAFHYGIKSILNGSGSGSHYGAYNKLSGIGNGYQYGSYTLIDNSGNGVQMGTANMISGTGDGPKYGTYNLIDSNSGGLNVAVYGEAEKTGSYAGYFQGDVKVAGKLKAQDSGGADMKAYVYGAVNYNGDIVPNRSSSGFTVTHTVDGEYEINLTNLSSSDFTVVATPLSNYPVFITASVTSGNPGFFKIYISDTNGDPYNLQFNFVVYKP